MSQIRCPHCGEVFTVDESGYAELVKQVRDAEFAQEVAERERLLMSAHAAEVKDNFVAVNIGHDNVRNDYIVDVALV